MLVKGHDPMLLSRPASGLEDLGTAGDLLTRAWSTGSPPGAAMRGDLSWWFAQAWPADLGERLRLWLVDGETVGWSWFDGEALDFAVWQANEETNERPNAEVERAILSFALEAAGEAGGGAVETWAADDDRRTRELLAELGFEPVLPAPDEPPHRHVRLSQFQRSVTDAASIPDRTLPPGYRIRSVAGEHEIDARVAVHRGAFAPSKMRAEKYKRLVRLPDYRYEDDLVVEAPDGSLASFAIAWWDPVALVGEFEPVGTDPRHQRIGLSAALLCHALGRYRALGANLVQVFSDADNLASEALYQSVGFRRRACHELFRREAG